MRKLATIERIIDIAPIEGADAIEVATVRGWKVVIAKKDGYKVGDLVVFTEVDAWIPHELAPFLSKGQDPREFNGIKGERLRTIKLRGQISQGLILPVSVIPKPLFDMPIILIEGEEVTDVLGIQKWEAPIPASLAGLSKGGWPVQIPKTDEERIQNLRKDLPRLNQMTVEITEKMEGSSCTMALIDGEFIVCSRNINLKETEDNTFWRMARQYDVENQMRTNGLDNFAIQGEVVGEGVQGNHYGLKGQRFYIFSMYDIVKGEYVGPNERRDLAASLKMLHVPVVASAVPFSTISTGLGLDAIDLVLQYADGWSGINPDKMREGVVFKQYHGQEHWKAVSNKYLLKTGG